MAITVWYFELALLAEDVYKQDIDNRGVNGWEPDVITGTANNFDSGLQIQNYQNACLLSS
jgi:hypothetical protein